MDIRQLRYFVRIVGCGSLSKAAAELHVAQPALSQHVANLEAELGVQLLSRSTRGVTATECGTILLGHAESILRQIDHAARDVRDHSANPSGKVTVGLPSSTSLVLTLPLLTEVERRYPKIQLRIIENHSGFLMEWVQAGRIDLAIGFDTGQAPGIALEPLLIEDLYLVSAPGIFAGERSEVTADDFSGLPLILTSQAHGVRSLIERYAASVGQSLTIKSELDALPAIKQLVASGFGYSVLPWSAIGQECAAGTLHGLKVTRPGITRHVEIATAADRPLLRAADTVRRLVRELAVSLIATDRWRGTLMLAPRPAEPALLP